MEPRRSDRSDLTFKSAFKGVLVALVLMSCVVNVLSLTGSFYMLQVYDRVLTSHNINTLVALSVLAVILFGFQIAINNIQTLPSDYLPGRSVGSLAGISGTAAVAGVLITTWIVPVATKVSYAPVFIMGASLVPLSILSIWLLGGRGERLVDPARAARPTNGANS